MFSEEPELSRQQKPGSALLCLVCAEGREFPVSGQQGRLQTGGQGTARLSLKGSSLPGAWKVLGFPLTRTPAFRAHIGRTRLLVVPPGVGAEAGRGGSGPPRGRGEGPGPAGGPGGHRSGVSPDTGVSRRCAADEVLGAQGSRGGY